MTESVESSIAFTHFINNLRNSGFKAIHILSHSMGIRLFLSAFGTQEVLFLSISFSFSRLSHTHTYTCTYTHTHSLNFSFLSDVFDLFFC